MTAPRIATLRRRVLIISPAFPPRSAPDSQRVRMSLPYYRENGWDPIVLCVTPAEVEAPEETVLLETIPADVPVYHCSALAKSISRRIGIGNLGWRAWWPLAALGAKLIREQRIDLVFFSTTQFALLPLGRIWRQLFGVPFVVDLQDPWRTDYYERSGVRRAPGGWKYQIARAQAALLEPWSFRKMSGLISVSEKYLHDLRSRYHWFHTVPSASVGFGASELDLEVAKRLSPALAPTAAVSSSFPAIPRAAAIGNPVPSHTFVYTGAAGPITPHAVSLLFSALALFRAEAPERAQRLRFQFIGTSYAPADRAEPTVLPIAEAFGVTDLVSESAARAGHLECIRAQAAADVLFLGGSSDLAYSPSKLYPYFWARRPILAIVFRNSVLERTLRRLGGAHRIVFAETEIVEARAQLVAYFRDLAEERLVSADPRDDVYFETHYLARSLTGRQTELFDRAWQHAQSDVDVI